MLVSDFRELMPIFKDFETVHILSLPLLYSSTLFSLKPHLVVSRWCRWLLLYAIEMRSTFTRYILTMTEGPELLEAHFSDEEMEALNDELACLRSQRM